MISNDYTTKENLVSTSISGGRSHFSYRQPVHSSTTYKYETSFGENLYSLSAVIFGTDELWWVLSDLNKPINPLDISPSSIIELPDDIVKDNGSKKFIG